MLLSLLLLSGFEPTICQFIFKYKFDCPLSEKLRIFDILKLLLTWLQLVDSLLEQ